MRSEHIITYSLQTLLCGDAVAQIFISSIHLKQKFLHPSLMIIIYSLINQFSPDQAKHTTPFSGSFLMYKLSHKNSFC